VKARQQIIVPGSAPFGLLVMCGCAAVI